MAMLDTFKIIAYVKWIDWFVDKSGQIKGKITFFNFEYPENIPKRKKTLYKDGYSLLTTFYPTKVNSLGIGAKVQLGAECTYTYIDRVLNPSDISTLPKYCPSCETKLEERKYRYSISRDCAIELLCKNKNCPAQKYKKLQYELKTFRIYLKEEHFIKLDINCVSDLFHLTEEKLENLGMDKAKIKDILKNIDHIKKSNLERILKSTLSESSEVKSCIKILVDAFDTLSNIAEKIPYPARILRGISLRKLSNFRQAIIKNSSELESLREHGVECLKDFNPDRYKNIKHF